MRDHNWQGALTGALKPVQHRDTESPYGQRSVLFSQHGPMLEGYSLRRRTPWETLVRTPLTCSVDRAALSARVELPALLPGVTFTPHTLLPYFSVVASLGVVPDLFYSPVGYAPLGDYRPCHPQVARTGWLRAKSGAPVLVLDLCLPHTPPNNTFALVLT